MDRKTNQIDLLIALLLRFPELGACHYEPDQKTLRLVVLLQDGGAGDFSEFARTFQNHLALFHYLKKSKASVSTVSESETPELTVLEIRRDLASLSLDELSLIMELIADHYGELLIREGGQVDEEEAQEQNTVLEALLTSVSWRGLERLSGFRENGRVLVFSIPAAEVHKS